MPDEDGRGGMVDFIYFNDLTLLPSHEIILVSRLDWLILGWPLEDFKNAIFT